MTGPGPLSVAILAGGRSTRFPGDKALTEHGGERLFESAVRRFAPLTDDIFIQLRAEQGELIDAVRATCPAVGISFDEPGVSLTTKGVPGQSRGGHHGGAGPLGGLLCAIRTARHDHVFAVAVDLPGVDGRLVQFLAASLDGGPRVVVPAWPDGRLEPLCAVYPKEADSELAKILNEAAGAPPGEGRGRNPALGLHRATDTLAARGFTVMRPDIPAFLEEHGLDEGYFANYNTPDSV
jgi:molybdopterin-guanine dinucleotide biosynthesis protein A